MNDYVRFWLRLIIKLTKLTKPFIAVNFEQRLNEMSKN